jgi:PAS domain S-box-containing protein
MIGRRDHLMWVLLALVVTNAVIAAILQGASVSRVFAGSASNLDYVATVALIMAGPVLLVGCVAVRRMRELQKRVTEREDMLANLSATSRDWLWQAGPDLVLTHCSPASVELLGYPASELVGHSVFDLVDPEDQARARATLVQAARDGAGWSDLELRWLHADGHTVHLEDTAEPVLDRRGALRGFRGARRRVLSESANARRLAAIVHRTRQVTRDRAVTMALQPIIDVAEGRWLGAEALARFRDGRGQMVWFDEAHEAGVGIELEFAAATVALDQLADLPPRVYLSFNASPSLILDPQFYSLVMGRADQLDRIVLEITEHAAVSRYDDIRSTLRPLRERGLRLAVDDTGAGYASFNHVLKLRPDVIKLDRSLVTDIDNDAARRAVVTAVVLMALELGSSVVGEGVERPTELEMLCSLGVDAAQGYLLGRPSTDALVQSTWATRDWLTHAGQRRPAGEDRPVSIRERARSSW